jgi:hypothetical protein
LANMALIMRRATRNTKIVIIFVIYLDDWEFSLGCNFIARKRGCNWSMKYTGRQPMWERFGSSGSLREHRMGW